MQTVVVRIHPPQPTTWITFRGIGAVAFDQSLMVGKPASVQPFQPPSMEITL